MIRRTGQAAAAAGLALGLATSAGASDLYDRDPPPRDRHGAYDDPRYADIYRHPPPPERPRFYRYGERPPIPRAPVYRDDIYRDDDDDRPPPSRYHPRRFADTHPWRPPQRAGCLPHQEIRAELTRDGWRDFHDADLIDRDTALVRARRPDGRLYSLKVDRCSGDILHARPLGDGFGPYAGGPRRWERWR